MCLLLTDVTSAAGEKDRGEMTDPGVREVEVGSCEGREEGNGERGRGEGAESGSNSPARGSENPNKGECTGVWGCEGSLYGHLEP